MNNSMNREIVEIQIEDIVPNRFQPRLTFDVEALNELANSIKEHGIIQPLVVRKLQDKFEIIAGERRYKAATLIGMQKVPCIIMNLSDNESAEVAVIENIQRKEMTSLEEAKSFKKILDKGYLTQEELAKRMGKSQSSVANKLRLLNLDDVVQDAILNNKISERHARSLLKLPTKDDQRKILSEIIEKRLTVRQTDDLIKEKYESGNNMLDEKQEQLNPVHSILSTPEINIPVNNITDDVNPQLNLMNNIGALDKNKFIEPVKEEKQEILPPERNNSSLDIFRYDTPQPVNQSEKQEDIQSVINPSVFSTPEVKLPSENTDQNFVNSSTNFNSYVGNNMNIDIDQVKSTAQDINPERKVADIDLLMKSDAPLPINQNKFFIDLNGNNEIIDFMEEQVEKVSKIEKVKDVINKSVNDLRAQGNNIYKEEIDLGSSYQIIIRIDK